MGTDSPHWSQKQEAISTYRSLSFYLKLLEILPLFVVKIIVLFVACYFYGTTKENREHSRAFLGKVSRIRKERRKSSLVHLMSFALYLVEKSQSWGGRFPFDNIEFQRDDIQRLIDQLESGQGAMLICSHLGNAELLRALAELDRTGVSRRIPTISIVDFSVSPNFFRMIEEVNPESMHHIISAKDIGPDTVIILQQHIEDGGLVVIAGDRTSGTTIDSYITLPFLGAQAPFATGPFLLAMVLDAPCYAVFGLREKTLSLFPRYKMFVEQMDIPRKVSRKERRAAVERIARQFAARLEALCLEYPYQWYNFFDFWAKPTLEKA